MATTAFHSAGLATLRRSSDRLARPSLLVGFLAQLKAFFPASSTLNEQRVWARFAGQRWCDATEQQMLNALGDSDRGRDWL
jgi:hypothetical protein